MYQLGPKNWKLKYIPDLPGGNQRWRAGNLPFSQTKPPIFVADFPATLDTLETLVDGPWRNAIRFVYVSEDAVPAHRSTYESEDLPGWNLPGHYFGCL